MSDSEVEKLESTLSSNPLKIKARIDYEAFKGIDYEAIKKSILEIIKTEVSPSKSLKELEGNIAKQQFAREGMKIHDRKKDDICAFCGNPISQDRWHDLDNYFSDKVQELEKRIKDGELFINDKISFLQKLPIIDVKDYHEQFKNDIIELKKDFNNIKEHNISILKKWQNYLKQKKDDIFNVNENVIQQIKDDNLKDLNYLITEYNKIYQENKDLNNNLEKQKNNAKLELKRHYVYVKIADSEYSELHTKYSLISKEVNELDESLSLQNTRIHSINNHITTLQKQSENESQAADDINKILRITGPKSFSLRLVKNQLNKGTYRIYDNDNKVRNINTLSTGEINALGFLYFTFKLNDLTDKNNKNRIIVMDDPVNSNDSSYQYLICSCIKQMLSIQNTNNNYVILTHNIQFYKLLTQSNRAYEKNGQVLHLEKNVSGKSSFNKIKPNQDKIKDIYNKLWDELKNEYDSNDTLSMFNTIRRIIDTYCSIVGNKKFSKCISEYMSKHNELNINSILLQMLNFEINDNSHTGLPEDSYFESIPRDSLMKGFKNAMEFINDHTKDNQRFDEIYKKEEKS